MILLKVKRREKLRKRRILGSTAIIPVLVLFLIFFQQYANIYRIKENTKTPYEGERIKENLDRGIIAMYNDSNNVYIGWRLLEDDPENITFNVYRVNSSGTPKKLNTIPINSTTDFMDTNPDLEANVSYYIRPIINGTEKGYSKNTTILNNVGEHYVSIALDGNYTFYNVGIADLNGDGSYDYVIKQPHVSIDPFDPPLGNWRPSQDTYKIEAYLSNGTFLWRNDLGWSIEQGTWYSPYVVYDFNGDSMAEIAVKTAEGDHRDPSGHVYTGPEYLSIWDGMTGEEHTRVAWPRRTIEMYNWYSRNQLGVAFIDGNRPSIMVARGTYGVMRLEAYDYESSSLEHLWHWDTTQEALFRYFGQGAHYLHSADVDSDGYDEVILGSCVIDDNGDGLWSTALQHPDHCYVGDIDPGRAGLEIYYGTEGIMDIAPLYDNGICMVDAATGKILWGTKETTYHIHQQGLVSDIDPAYPGMECYSGEDEYPNRWLHSANGTLIANENTFDIGLKPKAVYWDADLQRELLFGGKIYDYESDHVHLQGITEHQIAWADILGDWREEIITSVEGELRIYTTTIPATDRRACLMQDPIYRADVAHLAMGYAQVPMTSYCLDNSSTTISIYPEPSDTLFGFTFTLIITSTVIWAISLIAIIIFFLVTSRNQDR